MSPARPLIHCGARQWSVRSLFWKLYQYFHRVRSVDLSLEMSIFPENNQRRQRERDDGLARICEEKLFQSKIELWWANRWWSSGQHACLPSHVSSSDAAEAYSFLCKICVWKEKGPVNNPIKKFECKFMLWWFLSFLIGWNFEQPIRMLEKPA